ncbi:hypothetical protein V8C42DRAFT_346708 [Trichoderma barbatum]
MWAYRDPDAPTCTVQDRVISYRFFSARRDTPAFLDNGEFFMDPNNVVAFNWPNVSAAFAKPVTLMTSVLPGYDWTQPYPGGGLIDGHNV